MVMNHINGRPGSEQQVDGDAYDEKLARQDLLPSRQLPRRRRQWRNFRRGFLREFFGFGVYIHLGGKKVPSLCVRLL
jgi:hypothetical protein